MLVVNSLVNSPQVFNSIAGIISHEYRSWRNNIARCQAELVKFHNKGVTMTTRFVVKVRCFKYLTLEVLEERWSSKRQSVSY